MTRQGIAEPVRTPRGTDPPFIRKHISFREIGGHRARRPGGSFLEAAKNAIRAAGDPPRV